MKRRILIIFFILSLIASIFFCSKHLTLRKNLTLLKTQLDHCETVKDLLKYSILKSVELSGCGVNNSVQTSEGPVDLTEIIKSHTLICMITESSCGPCVNRELTNISLLEKEGIPILIMASFSNKRSFKLILKEFDVHSKCIFLDQVLFQPEKHGSDLFYFVLTKKKDIKLVFFPVQTESDLSAVYINLVKDYFEENEIEPRTISTATRSLNK